MKTGTILFCFILSWPFLAFSQDKKILVIESYHPSLTWTRQCEQGINTVLSSQFDLHFFYMDTKRIPKSQFPLRADSAWATYLQLKPDLVLIGDDNGLELLGHRFSKTITPVVFFGINNNPRSYFNAMPPNFTGILERVPITPWLRYLKEIHPNIQSALILMDHSPTSLAIMNMNFNNKTQFDLSGISFQSILSSDWESWKQTVLSAHNYGVLVLPTFHTVMDKEGNHIPVDDVIQWTSINSPVPFYTNQDYTVHENGAVGAFVVQGVSHGEQAARIALSILNQKSSYPLKSPVTDRKGVFYFNKKQMKRFHVTLPDDIRDNSIFQ